MYICIHMYTYIYMLLYRYINTSLAIHPLLKAMLAYT